MRNDGFSLLASNHAFHYDFYGLWKCILMCLSLYLVSWNDVFYFVKACLCLYLDSMEDGFSCFECGWNEGGLMCFCGRVDDEWRALWGG